jgi:hypothetical protein
MITATVPTQRPKLAWQDIIKSKEDYETIYKTGLLWVYFPNIGTWKECEEELNKEKSVDL